MFVTNWLFFFSQIFTRKVTYNMLYVTFAADVNLPAQRVCISICVIYFVYFNSFLVQFLFILGVPAFSKVVTQFFNLSSYK